MSFRKAPLCSKDFSLLWSVVSCFSAANGRRNEFRRSQIKRRRNGEYFSRVRRLAWGADWSRLQPGCSRFVPLTSQDVVWPMKDVSVYVVLIGFRAIFSFELLSLCSFCRTLFKSEFRLLVCRSRLFHTMKRRGTHILCSHALKCSLTNKEWKNLLGWE